MTKWGQRLLVTAGVLLGVFLVAASLVQVPAVARTMNSPQACDTCHSMEPQVTSLRKSAHHQLTCGECHVAQGFLAKPLDEAKSASRHLWTAVTGAEPDVIRLHDDSRRVVNQNCQSCHSATVRNMHPDQKGVCTDCHRTTPHDRMARIGM